MSGIDSDLIRGHIDTIILKVLFEGDKYGIEICKEVEEKSGGTYELKQPTLYSCLKRLENQGLISSYWTDSDIGGKRHYYKLTDQGKETYRHNQEEWLRSRQIIDNLISNTYADASSYALVKKDEIKDLEEKAEKAEQQLEELQEQIEEGVLIEAANVEVNHSIDNEPIQRAQESEEDNQRLFVEADEQAQEAIQTASEQSVASETTDESIAAKPAAEVVVETSQTQEPSSDDGLAIAKFDVDDDDEIIPWNAFASEAAEDDDKNQEDVITYSWAPKIDVRETDGESALVSIAPNGEEMAAVISTVDDQEDADEPQQEPDVNEAQASLFEESEDVFSEDIDYEKLEEQYSPAQPLVVISEESQEDSDEGDVVDDAQDDDYDILELLGHTIKDETAPIPPDLYEEEEQKDQVVAQEEVSPFSFRMEDFVTKSKNSYFESEEVLDPTPDYVAPEMVIDGLADDEEFIEDDVKDADGIYEPEPEYSSPVYHDFGTSSFERNFNHKIEETEEVVESSSDDEIYSPAYEEETEKTAIVDDDLKLFGEDLFEDNEEYVVQTEEHHENVQVQEPKAFEPVYQEESESVENNQQVMDFYKSTENYDNITPKYTDEEYKEKLTSIITYGNYEQKEQEQALAPAPSAMVYDASPKDYTDLKTEFEKEGLVVRTHHKMVKESKHTRSYIESNKLNMVNSWTAFGIIACIVALTYLIMYNYGANVATYDFSYKYFLIGICCLAIIPVIYTMIYFINPYKKKPARYASRIYLLFAILLTVQLYLIIYCINLQLGFYSFAQPNYNHLLWIVPCLLALYPLADAILHTVYFNSKNFHV